MGQLKIGIATGFPFAIDVIGHLGIFNKFSDLNWIFELGSQISSNNEGIRPATQEEILANQHFIREHWTPKVGDYVVISSPLSSFMNKEGKIVEKRTKQFKIQFSKYVGQLAYCLEDIVPRAEDWAVIKEEIDDEYSSLVFNNVEFKKLDAGVQADLRKLDLDFVKTIFSLVTRTSAIYEKKSLGSFLEYFTIWNESPQGYVFWQEINNWVYKDRFEDANNSFKEWKLKVETRPVPIMEEIYPKRFKVGDKVTYKSIKEAGGSYYHGGEEYGGFVGTIVKYVYYNENKKCYEIIVTAEESFDYTMLESEFREYDELKPSVSSEFYVEVPVPEVYRHNVVLVEKKEKVKEITDSSLYSQEPVLLSKRPVKTKIKPII